jgi:hypothetical protein
VPRPSRRTEIGSRLVIKIIVMQPYPRQYVAADVLFRAEIDAERLQIVQCQFDILLGGVPAVALGL